MNIYIDMLLTTAIVVYIVDLSGWTDTWLGWLSRFTQKHGYGRVSQLRPFTCGQCMTWWCCLALALIRGELTLATTAAAAGYAFLSRTIGSLMILIREGIQVLLATFDRWIHRD